MESRLEMLVILFLWRLTALRCKILTHATKYTKSHFALNFCVRFDGPFLLFSCGGMTHVPAMRNAMMLRGREDTFHGLVWATLITDASVQLRLVTKKNKQEDRDACMRTVVAAFEAYPV